MSIAELADEVGLTRRAIRFYVQQSLLPPPEGRGRGSHYTQRHLAQLRRVMELQQAGHSLEAIRRLIDEKALFGRIDALGGAGVSHPPPTGSENNAATEQRSRAATANNGSPEPAVLRAELWTRLRVGEGLELSFDATRHNPSVEQLLALRKVIRDTLL